MKKRTAAIFAILGGAALAAGSSGMMIMENAAGGRRQTLEEARKWQAEHYDLSWYDDVEKENYTVSGFEGYQLHAMALKSGNTDGKYVIITHGYSDNRNGSLKYARIYLELGFNCILYDLRGHGENEPSPCTYGVLESKDLLEMIRDTRERFGEDIRIGLHGESLGAATTLTALAQKPDVAFAVADCGFADIAGVLKRGVKKMHLPPQVVDIASLCSKIRYGYGYDEMRPVDHLSENRIPVIFIHGAADDFIVPENSRRMYEATKGYRELHLIPGAGHAESVLTDYDGYREILMGTRYF